MWMRNERLRRIVSRNRVFRFLSSDVQTHLQLALLRGHKSKQVIDTIESCRKKADSLLSGDESFMLHALAQAQTEHGGAFAEFGVYKGCSARLLCSVKGATPLHLFDTFSGLPKPSGAERGTFRKGEFRGTLTEVQNVLTGYKGVHFHQGVFPASTAGLENLRFSFVHLDVDLEGATYAGLEFFYPRMLPGGILITHDYSIIPGVRNAVDRFMTGRSERVIELPTTQAMIIRSAGARVMVSAEAEATAVAA